MSCLFFFRLLKIYACRKIRYIRLIGGIFVLMVLWIPHAVKVEPLKAKLPIWLVWLAAFAALFALAIVGAAG